MRRSVPDNNRYNTEGSRKCAVASARSNDAAGVGTNLKKAIEADPDLKETAVNDLEFSNFATAVNEAVK